MGKNVEKRHKIPQNKSKVWKIALIAAGVVILLVAGAFIYLNSMLGIDDKDAVLYPQGPVSVIRDGKTMTVSSEFALEEEDIIYTQDSDADVYIHESVFISLEPDSRIILEDLDKDDLRIRQQEGRSFNKITNILGVSKYTLLTPNGDVIVHGTGFEAYVYDNHSIILVSDGKVVFNSGTQSVNLTMLEKAESSGGIIQKLGFTAAEKARIIAALEDSRDTIVQRRYALTMQFIEENGAIIRQLENQFDIEVNEETVRQFYSSVDSGETDLSRLRQEVEDTLPLVNTEFIDYIGDASAQIAKHDALIAQVGAIADPE